MNKFNHLENIIKNELGRKVNFYGVQNQYRLAKYNPVEYSNYDSYDEYKNDEVEFAFYVGGNDNFFRLRVSSQNINSKYGYKLAVLSDLYKILKKEFGNANIYFDSYDNEEMLGLIWTNDKEHYLNLYRTPNLCTETLIDLEEKVEYDLNEDTINYITDQIGLPLHLLTLLDENIDDFMAYKNGETDTLVKTKKQKYLK